MNEDRQRLCSGIATALAGGNTLFELSVAARIGARAGWSSDRITALQEKADAIQQVTSDSRDANDFWSCKHLEKVEARTAALLRYGEVGAGERALQTANYPEAELARQWRQQVRTSAKNAEDLRK